MDDGRVTLHQDLRWCFRQLAQLQGVSIDRVGLEKALKKLESDPDLAAKVKALAGRIGWLEGMPLERLDVVNLPILAQHRDGRWGLVIKQTPDNQWVLSHADGRRECLADELLVRMALKPRVVRSVNEHRFRAALKKGLGQYAGVFKEALFASFFINALTAVVSFFSMLVYDKVIPTKGFESLIVLFSGALLLILIEWGMKIARAHIMEHAATGLDVQLARDLFARLLGVRLDQMPQSVGSLASQLRGYEQVRGFCTAATFFTVVDIPFAFIFVFLIIQIGTPLVALVPVVMLILALAYGLWAKRRLEDQIKSSVEDGNKKTGVLVEAVEAAETIKATAAGWQFLHRWMELTSNTVRSDLRVRRISEHLSYFVATLQQVGYTSLVVVGALAVFEGEMTMGALIACSILGGRVMGAVLQLPNLLGQYSHAKAAIENIERLYEREQDYSGVSRPIVPGYIKGQFDLEAVTFGYSEDAPTAVRVPRLSIKPGERVGVIGPIGSGKSTLVRMLAGLYKPSRGRVLIDGVDIAHVSRAVLAEHCGYLAQDFRLIEGTLRSNLLIGIPDPGDAVLHQAITATGLAKMVTDHPKGLDMPIQEGGRGMSRGQRQLVSFTRVMLSAPSVLLLDEPTASMDDATERRCMALLSREESKVKSPTVVLVTHKMTMLALVDRLIVMVDGAVVMDGPKNEVLKNLAQRQPSLATTSSTAEPQEGSSGGSPSDFSPARLDSQ